MQTQDRGHAPQTFPHSNSGASTVQAGATQCFSVQAMADPGTLPRVIEVFAKRGLVPDRIQAAKAPAPKRDLVIEIDLDGYDAEAARLIAQELRRQFCVEAVLVTETQPTG